MSIEIPGGKDRDVAVQQGPKDQWQPILAEWAVQADALPAMITSLEEHPNDLNALAQAFVGAALVHSGLVVAKELIKKFAANRYQRKFEEGGSEELLRDLHRQRAWLAEHNNIPPVPVRSWASKVIMEALQERYGKNPQE